MLGEASDFTPLDLLGSLGLNVLATHTVVKRGEGLRIGPKIKGTTRAWTDYRFLGGAVAAVAAQFGGPTVRRVAHDVASGLLHSYVSTETINMIADKERKAQAAQAAASASPAALPAPAPAMPTGAPTGTPAYAGLGW